MSRTIVDAKSCWLESLTFFRIYCIRVRGFVWFQVLTHSPEDSR